MKHINAANTEHAWAMINILGIGNIHHDSAGSESAGYDIYEASNARISDLGNRVEVTYYDGSEPITYWIESTDEPEVIYVVEDDAKSEADIWSDFLYRYPAEVLEFTGVFRSYEEAVKYLDILKARDPSQANWGSVYIETEREKYALIHTLKKFGVPFNVSGCGTGYHVSIRTMGQADIDLVNNILCTI